MRQLRQLRFSNGNDSSENEQIRRKSLKCIKNLMQILIQAAWHAGQWTTYEENAASKTIRLRWAGGL